MKRLTRLGSLLLLFGLLIIPAHAASAPDAISDLCNDEAWEVLALTNKQRMNYGLLPLSTFPTLQQVSNLRTDELVTFYSHTRPDGSDCFTAAGEFGLSYSLVAENIAAGYRSPGEVVTGWMNSSGHRANILNSGLVHAAMGFTYASGSEWTYHWAQYFLTDFGCNITAIRVLPGENGFTLYPDSSVEELNAAVELTCAKHGACYLPLIEEMCTLNETAVTVTYGDLTYGFELTYDSTLPPPSSVTKDGFTAEIENGEATLVSFSYTGSDIIRIPETIGGCPVVKLGDGLFQERYDLSVIYLPDTLREIGNQTFYGTNLTYVGPEAAYTPGAVCLSDKITGIGRYAFSYMYDISEFTVDPNNPSYASLNGALYGRDEYDPELLRTLYNYPIASTRTEYTVPETVRMLYCTSFAAVTNLDTLYILSPNANCMTYTFYRSDFKTVCTGYSPVYAALSKAGSKSAEIVPYIISYKDDDRIVFDMSYTFDVAQFYLAAYDADGRMIDIQYVDNIHSSLSWYHNAVIEVYHADKVEKVKLFQFDDSYSPTGEAMTLWEA